MKKLLLIISLIMLSGVSQLSAISATCPSQDDYAKCAPAMLAGLAGYDRCLWDLGCR